MKVYSVHMPTGDTDPENTVFIKEGFSWPALFFSVFWSIYHHMWIISGLLFALIIVIGFLGKITGLSEDIQFLLQSGLGLLFAFEANDLRRWSLARKGFEDKGVVQGGSQAEGEEKYFTGLTVNE